MAADPFYNPRASLFKIGNETQKLTFLLSRTFKLKTNHIEFCLFNGMNELTIIDQNEDDLSSLSLSGVSH